MKKLIVHVGPHKTGTTSIQGTLFANRDRLLKDRILYPLSIKNAIFPQQHSEIAFAVKKGNSQLWKGFFQKMDQNLHGFEIDTVIISGEEFSNLANNDYFDVFNIFLEENWHLRYVYIKRDLNDLILSNLMQHLFGEVGTFFHWGYDLERLIRSMVTTELKKEKFFTNRNSLVINYDFVKGDEITIKMIELSTGKRLDYLISSARNVLNDKMDRRSNLILTYPLRVMLGILRNESNLSKSCVTEAVGMLNNGAYDESQVQGLVDDFRGYLVSTIDLVLQTHCFEK